MLRQVTISVIIGTFLVGAYYVVAASYIPAEQQSRLAAQLEEFQPGLTFEVLLSMDERQRATLVQNMPSDTVLLLMQEVKSRPSFVSETLDEIRQVSDSDVKLVKFAQVTALKGHSASGTAVLVLSGEGEFLRLEHFSVSPGIDLRVFLTKDGSIFTGVDLGPLKATSGPQNYAIPAVNTEEYNIVIIYSSTFDEYYAHARFI